MKVKKVSRRQYEGKVYNIGTPPVHNYYANDVLVHNCYQGSTLKGQHTKLETIDSIFRTLGKMEVFEVALGGGETTMHPNFAEILEKARYYGLVPNFTTFNMRWTKNKTIEEAVLKYAGGFAVSLTGNPWECSTKINEVNDWIEEHTKCYGGNAYNVCQRIQFQLILGLHSTKDLCAILANIAKSRVRSVTLLGYKSFGRGLQMATDQKVHEVDMVAIIEAAKKHYITLGLDTKAVQNYNNVLNEIGISELLKTFREGVFSMYIDGVRQVISKDSYTEEVFPFTNEYGKKNTLENVMENVFPFTTTVVNNSGFSFG